jgi:hypothetical protein
MLRFPVRPDALPLNLIWNFETTSSENRQRIMALSLSREARDNLRKF